MNTLQRPTEPRTNATAAGGGDSSGNPLAALRAQTRSMLAAGDEAIDRALEADSDQYMANRPQRGGQ